MASTVSDLLVRLGVDDAKFRSGLNVAEARAKSFSIRTTQYLKNIENAANSIEKINYRLFNFSVASVGLGTLKNYVGNGQQNLHIRGSRLSNPYTMIDYCQKNKSGCIVARQILSSLNINDGFVPLEKPFKLQVCFAFKKNNSKTETMHTFMDYVQSESPPRL